MNTVFILGGCLAVLTGIVILLLRTTPYNDPEHTLDASRRRHPSTQLPTHVRGPVARPYDWERDR